ncbi:MAG TPA: sigma 54-interacting transcriptional regulator [Candidatus Binatia bacterium]|nr:sigma 54-interacting transcriptional regulator [Candidatus Binatia bacterium]
MKAVQLNTDTLARILVVEDESIVAVDIASRLERIGYQVVGTARTAQAAYELADKHRPDLVLMDVRIEGEEDGISASVRIRNDFEIPVVFLTAYADGETIERAREAAPLGYIIKPFDQRDLQVTVELALHRSRIHQQLRKSRDDLQAILDVQRQGTVLTDPDGTITFLSQAAHALLRTTPDSGVGQRWQEVFPLSMREREELEKVSAAPQDSREKVLVQPQVAGTEGLSVEVEIKDDVRTEGARMFFLYDVSRVVSLERMLGERASFGNIMGHSESMQRVFMLIRDFATMEAPVLVDGETGVGKELVARAIHEASPRSAGPFVAVNCAGLSEELAASQLFGHARGAFTGAVSEYQGLFRAAHRGTLFLDEIGELSPRVQATLLRVLEERVVQAVGKTKGEPVDVRVIAATNRSLSREVDAGNFRADLFYRIRAATITLPPLRERKDDLLILVRHFLEEQAAVSGKPVRGLATDTMRILHLYEWPGNVRELRNAVAVATARCRGTLLQPEDLPAEVVDGATSSAAVPRGPLAARLEILEALDRAGGNRSKAAQLLGVSRATFYRRLTALGVPIQDSSDL